MLLSRRERIDNINHNSTLLLSFFCPLSLLFFQKKLECNPRLAVFIWVEYNAVWRKQHISFHILCQYHVLVEAREKLINMRSLRKKICKRSMGQLVCFDMFPDSENSIKIMCQKKLKCYSLKWEKKNSMAAALWPVTWLYSMKSCFSIKLVLTFQLFSFFSLFTNYFAGFNTGEKSRYCYTSDDVKDQAYWVSCAKVEWERENYLVIIL